MLRPVLLLLSLAATLALSAPAPSAGATPPPTSSTTSTPSAAQRLSQADVIAWVRVVGPPQVETLEIMPLQHIARIPISVMRRFRGRHGALDRIVFHTGDRSEIPRAGDELVVGLRRVEQNLGQKLTVHVVVALLPATIDHRAMADRIARVPFAETRTGGPMAGPIALSIDQVAPPKHVKWSNPFGDGTFRITVTNDSHKRVSVPALRSEIRSGQRVIRWDASLKVMHRERFLKLPRLAPVGRTSATVLAPGESVSVELSVLNLEGIDWPGGGRLGFTFALGEHSVSSFFYYHHHHHGALRAALPRP